MKNKLYYDKAVQDKLDEYLSFFENPGTAPPGFLEHIPTIAGMARYAGKTKRTFYQWKDDPRVPEFHERFSRCEELREIMLVNKGLSGAYNSMIVRLMLAKHGYSEKSEVNHTSDDGSMSPDGLTPEQRVNKILTLLNQRDINKNEDD